MSAGESYYTILHPRYLSKTSFVTQKSHSKVWQHNSDKLAAEVYYYTT